VRKNAFGLLLLLLVTPMGAVHPYVWKNIVDVVIAEKQTQRRENLNIFWIGRQF
jgi:hypothetical protein